MGKRRLLAWTILFGSASVLAAPTFAAGSTDIEQVVVTATKRSVEIKDVPMAVTVVSGETLDRMNARSFEDYINTVPGMNLIEASPTHPQLVLRGINAGGVGSTVGTYMDETPYGSSSALANGSVTAPNLDTFDIQRIEVLRGPQGTLYGASTLGGLLKFVTNAPDPSAFDDKFEFGGTKLDNGGAGGFARGMINFPITDELAIRATGYDSHDPGWIDDPGRGLENINGVTSYGGRLSLLYRPTDKFTVRLTALQQKIDASNDAVEDVLVLPGDEIVPKYGDYQEQRTINQPSSARYGVYNATFDWNVDWATLTSATSYGLFHDTVFTDASGVFGILNVAGFLKVDKFTQEVRLASNPGSGPLDWLVGGYYTHEVTDLHQDLVFAPTGPVFGSIQLDSKYIETAAFADATYHFTPDLDVSLGGRFAHNSQGANEFGLATATGNSSENIFTWSAAAHYKLDEETSLYARIAKGFRPGGPNPLPIGNPTGAPTFFGSDSLINYEAGVKGDYLGGMLSLDADAFYIDWTGIQLLTVINNTGVDINGGSARSLGFEWDTQWRPLENLTLAWSGAYTDAQLTAPTPALVGGQSGDPLPWAPKWTTTFDGDYRFDGVGEWIPYVGATWRYIGHRASDFQAGSHQIELPAYNTLGARVGLDWKNWELELYAKNLNNAKGITAFSATGTSAASGNAANAALIAPRLFGVVLRGKF